MRRSLALLVLLALASAGCGSDGAEPAALATAEAVPASAIAYVSVQSDLDADQWQQVEELVERFPGGEGAFERLREPRSGVEYERDVEPALGPTVELVWLEESTSREDVVLLTQPDDEAKLRELLRREGEQVVTAEVAGWTAAARGQALLDRYREALDAGTLADDEDFRADMADLPDDALAKIYVDAERAFEVLEAAGGATAAPSGAAESLRGGAAALEATDDGFRLTAHMRGEDLTAGGVPVGELLGQVPSGAFLALDFRAPGEDTKADPRLDELDRRFGLPLSSFARVLEGELALYARRGVLIPELTLLAAPPDAEAVLARLDDAVASTPILSGAERRTTSIDGVQTTVLDLGRFTILYAAVDDRVVVTTLPEGIRAARAGGDKLVDDDRYRDAIEAAGVEEGEEVVAYVAVQEGLRLLEGLSLLGEGGIAPETSRDLSPLRSFVAASRTTDDESTFRVFLEIAD